MLAYKYDEVTKEYLRAQEAQPNPLEGGYLLPAFCTFEVPPSCGDEEVQVFNGTAWEIKEDHRGHYQVDLSDKTTSIVTYIGSAEPGYQFISDEVYNDFMEDSEKYDVIDGVFQSIEDSPEYLVIVKNRKYNENNLKATEARVSKTFTITLQEKECEFDTKAQTQSDLLSAFAVCSTGATYDGWVCNNGVVINLTMEDLVKVQVKFKELSNVYPHWNYYKKLIDEATTVAEVKAIEIDYTINID